MNASPEPIEIMIEITEEQYRRDLEAGLQDHELLLPGPHTFKRGGFMERHGIDPEWCRSPVKVRATVDLDLDIVTYFRERASEHRELLYEDQINEASRRIMEQEERGSWA